MSVLAPSLEVGCCGDALELDWPKPGAAIVAMPTIDTTIIPATCKRTIVQFHIGKSEALSSYRQLFL
jgi:hypothetical protein